MGVWRLPDGNKGLQITGGPGVGTVTRPGTGIEVGEPAVTRVPRRMMTDAVAQGLIECGWPPETGVRTRITVPSGEEIAKQTTNARLGVLGGISILGSTGVVQPFSTAAWRASVHLAVDVAATNGLDHLVLSTGTRSEEYTRRLLELPDMAYIEAGIFSGPSMKRCVNKGIKRVAHVGMVGKFSKMAMGYFVTHVAGKPCRYRVFGPTRRAMRCIGVAAAGNARGRQRSAFPGTSSGTRRNVGVPPDVSTRM